MAIAATTGQTMTGQINNQQDNYADRLVKLLPAEGIAALTAINGIIDFQSSNKIWIVIVFLVIGAFVFLWAKIIRGVTSWLQLGFTVLAYVLWATNILWPWAGMIFPQLHDAKPYIPAVLTILFTLFIPFVFPAPAPPQVPVKS